MISAGVTPSTLEGEEVYLNLSFAWAVAAWGGDFRLQCTKGTLHTIYTVHARHADYI